jgi:hypothetical protein
MTTNPYQPPQSVEHARTAPQTRPLSMDPHDRPDGQPRPTKSGLIWFLIYFIPTMLLAILASLAVMLD